MLQTAASALILVSAACSKDQNGNGAGKEHFVLTIDSHIADYTDGSSATVENEMPESISACIFREGILSETFQDIQKDGYRITTAEKTGNLYIIAYTGNAVDIRSLTEGKSDEDEWKRTAVSDDVGILSTGFTDIAESADTSGKTRVGLVRSHARVDLEIESPEKITVESIELTGVRNIHYLFPQNHASSPEGSGTCSVRLDFATPVSENTEGIAYICEQFSPELTAGIRINAGGKTVSRTVRFPEEIRRNTVYCIKVGKDFSSSEITASVVPWDSDGIAAVPDFGSSVRISIGESDLDEGITVSEDRIHMTLPYTGTDFLLALECNEELEPVSDPEYGFTVEPAGGNRTAEAGNVFRIRKEMWRIGVPGKEVRLQFKRKGLDNIYPDDCIGITVLPNPTTIEGLLDFSNSHEHDFGRYIDNELGRLSVPEGRSLTVEFEDGEDPWILLDPAEEEEGTYRIIGGWRPNDRRADGRIQSARLVICNAEDGSEREEYTVSRRNWGLPVTRLNGIWWCKYNAMGNSRDFEDQILSSEDPAALAGMELFEYLDSCSPEEYLQLWKWEYQGDSGIGLEVKDIGGLAALDGFRQDIKVHINSLDPKNLAPDGYELPSYDDFGRLFGNVEDDYIWIMWNGSHVSPWNGGTNIQRRNRRRNNVTLGSVVMNDLFFMKMYENGNTDDEPLVFYGAGAQWDNSGVKHGHYNNMLFASYSEDRKGWYFNGSMAGLYITPNGAGNNDSRILRFRKSDVEYIY